MPENNNFTIKTAEWRGYTLKALEDIDKDLVEIKGEIKTINSRVTNMEIKMASIGGIVSLLVTILVNIIF